MEVSIEQATDNETAQEQPEPQGGRYGLLACPGWTAWVEAVCDDGAVNVLGMACPHTVWRDQRLLHVGSTMA
jgi:hypothetical protein